MVSIEELKLGNETLEALKFLLSQITELETAINQINISEIKDANTLTKEQIATLQDVKNTVESINIELSSKKSDFDEKKQNFDNNMSAFRADKADFDEKKADFDSKNSTALSNFAFISSNVEKINSTSALLAEAKTVLETIKPIEQRTQAALNTIANSQAKFDELDALKATLLELKRSLENISTTGLIKDDSASATTAYSSQKLDTLLNKKLDISEKEAMFSNGKIKAELLPNIDATTLNGKRADEFELKTESTTKYSALSQNIGTLEGSLSTLTNALGNKIDTSLKGVADGVATLNNEGRLEEEQLPLLAVTHLQFNDLLARTLNEGEVKIRRYVNENRIVQELGEHKDLIMSQKAVSDALNAKSGGVIMLENEASPITTTTLGAQFYCKSNSGIYVLIDNSELTKESKLSEAANKGKIVKNDKGISELSWLKNSNPSSVKAFFGYANIYSSNTSITFPSSFSSHYTIILGGGPYYSNEKKGFIFGVYGCAPDGGISGNSIGGAISTNISASFSLSKVTFSLANSADLKLTYFAFGY